MFKPFLAGTAIAFFSLMPAHATPVGATQSTPCPFGDCTAGISLAYAGEFDIATGTIVDGVEFGGLSGIDFDPATGHYVAISDDRSEKAPARFYELQIDAAADGIKAVNVLRSVTLKTEKGEAFALKTVDPEAIRLGKDGIFWTSEGDAKQLLPPFLRLAGADGAFVRDFALPQGFAPTSDNASGIRNNLAFEGLTLLPDGDAMVQVESSLNQDGPIASLTSGALARMIRYDRLTGEPKAEYVYPIEPISQAPKTAKGEKGWNDNGVSEILALDNHRLLVLERGFAEGFGNSIRLYMVDTDGATDVRSVASLVKAEQPIVPLRKSQVLDLRAMGLAPDNLEGMTFGKGSDGSDLLIFVSDNNFNPQQKTQFYAFKVLARP
ncbi:esterase-like activity of phytase family protein [Rhizobium sp. SSA_523]|uniref:esterase-like activity of phytase family protein n=1 Tax=Rhizobium sp. SSA_523 TaxID=2952477 RepID=UPI0020914571|nr:esterase-like activity of phytase family protein [Rhizobium sp. SSA_523]MCO5730513.1 esterase-like activity of phytase family protein [Rhizobium sp. SSA_523]WKC25551.1 esterase-like activity of phytase family protein [Rhizobium sp. SSA_523]